MRPAHTSAPSSRLPRRCTRRAPQHALAPRSWQRGAHRPRGDGSRKPGSTRPPSTTLLQTRVRLPPPRPDIPPHQRGSGPRAPQLWTHMLPPSPARSFVDAGQSLDLRHAFRRHHRLPPSTAPLLRVRSVPSSRLPRTVSSAARRVRPERAPRLPNGCTLPQDVCASAPTGRRCTPRDRLTPSAAMTLEAVAHSGPCRAI
jgi:hypothetical protein